MMALIISPIIKIPNHKTVWSTASNTLLGQHNVYDGSVPQDWDLWPVHEDDGAEEPPGAALPVHVEHPQDLGADEQVGETK